MFFLYPADALISHLPSPVSVTSSREKKVTGTPSKISNTPTTASSETERFRKVMYLSSDAREEGAVDLRLLTLFVLRMFSWDCGPTWPSSWPPPWAAERTRSQSDGGLPGRWASPGTTRHRARPRPTPRWSERGHGGSKWRGPTAKRPQGPRTRTCRGVGNCALTHTSSEIIRLSSTKQIQSIKCGFIWNINSINGNKDEFSL